MRASAILLILLLVAVLLPASRLSAQTPNPVYFSETPDAVTGDNVRVQVNHPSATCGSSDPCYLPDPNPSSGSVWVDNYSLDIYERPMGQGSSAKVYLPWIDITSSAVGYDANFLYYKIDLYGTESGKLPSYYSFEINFDSDPLGDILVRAEAPSAKVGTSWGTSGVIAYHDTNQNMGGPRPTTADGPSNTLGGYENLVFDQGSNKLSGAPGGATAVRARISPTDPTVVELAVSRAFLVALNENSPVEKAAFRPYAAKGSNSPSQFQLHDEYTRSSAGSPYPWLRVAGAPSFCPSSLAAENALTAAQRDALNSGTSSQTSFLNPCYPASSIYEFDNGGTVENLSAGDGLQFRVDLAVTKTASHDPIAVNGHFSYSIVASNLTTGAGKATNVVVTDQLPAGVTVRQITTTKGSCAQSGSVVTCSLGDFANGATATITLAVSAPPTAGAITNTVSIDPNETDVVPGNDSASVQSNVIVPIPLVVTKLSAPLEAGGFSLPGKEMVYSVQVSNPSMKVSESTIVLVDAMPSDLVFYNGDFDPSTPGMGPIRFVDGGSASGLTCCAAQDVSYSDDPIGTASPVFDYVPQAGFDANVRFIRINPKGVMAAAGNTVPSFTISFRGRIK